MKLKKLLAAVTAAALAVSTMAVTGFTASAEEEAITFGVAGDPGFVASNIVEKYESFTVTVEGLPAGEGDGKCGHAVAEEGETAGEGVHPAGTTTCDWGGVQVYGKISVAPWNASNTPVQKSLSNNKATFDASEFEAWKSVENYSGISFSTWGCTITSIVGTLKEGGAEPEPLPANITIAFDDTTELELKVIDASSWHVDGVTKAAQKNVEAYPTGVIKGTTTYGELKNTTLSVSGINFKNFSVEGLTAADVSVSLYAQWGSGWTWTASQGTTWDLSTLSGDVADDDVLQELGYQVNINGNKGGINDMDLNDIVKVNSPDSGTEPDPDPVTPPAEDKTHEGSATLAATNYDGWYEVSISKSDLFGNLDPAKTTIVFTGANLTKVGYNSISEADYKGNDCTGTFTLDASDINVGEGYFVHVGGNAATEVTWVATEKNSGTPVTPDDPPATTETIVMFEGESDALNGSAGNSLMIYDKKDIGLKEGDVLKVTYTINGDEYQQIAPKSGGEGWPSLPSLGGSNIYIDLAAGSSTYTLTLSAEDATIIDTTGLIFQGHNITITKVEIIPKATTNPPVVGPTPDDPAHTHTPATTWSSDATGHWHACSGCTDPVDFAAHTSDGGTVTTAATATTAGTRTYKCTVCGFTIRTETIPATGSASEPVYPPYIVGAPVIPVTGVKDSSAPTINGQNGWEAVVTEITAASDGDKLIVDMNSATKVPSTVFKAIKGKDVDIVLNMSNGIKWTINGLSVTSTKAIDFDVTKNTKHIPNEVVDKAEGSHKRQISLDHNGSFGCNAVMTYEVGTQYNGLYANLFYYNRKAKELELIDCSPISGGKANFLFTHASDYLITISDEPLGGYEDVSSAAGITSDNSGVSSIAFCAVLTVITLAFGFVVYKKRRHN
ncbi:MAG: hypothetical protein HDT21_12950 [Ruminococcus sp.]|nr:hypothetical protein [Ruminococcus sp.]